MPGGRLDEHGSLYQGLGDAKKLLSEDAKMELIKRFEEFPPQVVAMAWLYAVGINKFGVDLSKEWETVTQKRADLDMAYRQGGFDEQKRWRKTEENRDEQFFW